MYGEINQNSGCSDVGDGPGRDTRKLFGVVKMVYILIEHGLYECTHLSGFMKL